MSDKLFTPFGKIARLTRDCVITEKLDGTNSSIVITEEGEFLTGSRNRWITPGKTTDNYGFSTWAHENKEELMKLGVGQHFGEWWGKGIQRGYGMPEKKFSLFNTHRFGHPESRPKCCDVVPVLYEGVFDTTVIEGLINRMREEGSVAAPGFKDPEGLIIYHQAAGLYFKKTVKDDEVPKGAKK